jgi:hypothetical protein
LKHASGGFELGSFYLAGHRRVDGFRRAFSKGADGRTPVKDAANVPVIGLSQAVAYAMHSAVAGQTLLASRTSKKSPIVFAYFMIKWNLHLGESVKFCPSWLIF